MVFPTSDVTDARSALVAACLARGLDPADAELVRVGTNAVFRLCRTPVIGRVMSDMGRLDDARREIAVSRWLADCHVSVIRALDISQPVVTDGHVVTFWESVSDSVGYGTTAELASILCLLHAQVPPNDLAFPDFDPAARARRRIEGSASLTTTDRAYLLRRLDEAEGAYGTLTFELPVGPIHGDANVGNVLRGRTGALYLADLDDFTIGPREWDLILTAMYFERYGWHTDVEYRTFCDTYGTDVMKWSGYAALADLRELLMIAWMAQKVAESPALAQEFDRRMLSLRTGAGRRRWQPF